MEHKHYTHSPQFMRILKEWDSSIGKEIYYTLETYKANPNCFPLYNITYPSGIRETDTVLNFQIRCPHCKTIHTCHVPDQSNEVEYLAQFYTTCTQCREIFHLLRNFLRESKSNLHQQQQQPPKSSAYTCVPTPDIHDIRQRLKIIRAEIAKLENIRKKLNMNDPQVYEAECWFKRNRKDKLDELKTQEKRLEKRVQQYKTERFNDLKEVVISLVALAFLTLIFISLLYTAHLFTKECDDTTKAIVNAGVIFGLPLLYTIVRTIYKKRAGIIKHLHSRMRPFPLTICALLGIATFDLPYGYYQFLRIAVTAWAILALIQANKHLGESPGKTYTLLLTGGIAILYNPVLPIRLDKDHWTILNLITIPLILLSTYLNGKISSPHKKTDKK